MFILYGKIREKPIAENSCDVTACDLFRDESNFQLGPLVAKIAGGQLDNSAWSRSIKVGFSEMSASVL